MALPALKNDAEDVGYFEPPDRKVQIALRMPRSLVEKTEGVVRLWKAMAEARGDDPKTIDRAYVLNRLISVGVDGAFEEVGGFPKDEEAWEKLLKVATKNIAKTK